MYHDHSILRDLMVISVLRDVSCYILLIYIVTLHYANEIITESPITTSRARCSRVNFKFSLGGQIVHNRISSLHVFCNSCRKLRRSATTRSTFLDIGCTACCIDPSDHRYSAKLCLFAMEISF